jgi:hypothetical protein
MDDLANKSRMDPLVGVLLATAGLLGALSLYQGAAYLDTSRLARSAFAQVSTVKETKPADVQAQVARDKSAADGLKKKNLFILPEPPRNPVTEVAGILGSEALINGQWYKAGAKVGQGKDAATIVAIEPTKVRVRWNGQVTELLPMNASAAASSARPSGPGPGSAPPGEARRGVPSPTRSGGIVVQTGGARRGGMSQEEMTAFTERMRNASSPQERQQIMTEMRQRSSGQ